MLGWGEGPSANRPSPLQTAPPPSAPFQWWLQVAEDTLLQSWVCGWKFCLALEPNMQAGGVALCPSLSGFKAMTSCEQHVSADQMEEARLQRANGSFRELESKS